MMIELSNSYAQDVNSQRAGCAYLSAGSHDGKLKGGSVRSSIPIEQVASL